MKGNKILMFAAAALTMAACSQNDPSTGVITPGMETSYAKVAIKMGNTTRAFGNYDEGTSAESEVTSLTLLLFDGTVGQPDGILVGSGNTNELGTPETQTGQNVSSIYTDVVRIALTPGSAQPTKLYAFVNCNPTYETEAELLADTTLELKTNYGYVMTNSVYKHDTKGWVKAVEISTANLFNTEAEAAAADAVAIHVERLAAKVTVSESAADIAAAESKIKYVGADGETEYKLVFTAEKWGVTGTAKSMFVIKKDWTEDLAWANVAGDFRSYWAQGVNYTSAYADYYPEEGTLLTYLSENDLDTVGADFGEVIYAPEHTFNTNAYKTDEASFSPKMTATNVIILGGYTVQDTEGNEAFKEGENTDFYLVLRGTDGTKTVYTIYSKLDLIKRLLGFNGLNELKKGSADGEALAEAEYLKAFDLEKDEETGKYKAITYKGDDAITAYNGENPVTDANLTATSPAKHYVEGKSYFFAPIQHNYVDEATVGSYGVVRNHSYVLTVKGYTGLGGPLDEDYDPDQPIEPSEDDLKDAYINAQLNVLSWHTVNQDIIL